MPDETVVRMRAYDEFLGFLDGVCNKGACNSIASTVPSVWEPPLLQTPCVNPEDLSPRRGQSQDLESEHYSHSHSYGTTAGIFLPCPTCDATTPEFQMPASPLRCTEAVVFMLGSEVHCRLTAFRGSVLCGNIESHRGDKDL